MPKKITPKDFFTSFSDFDKDVLFIVDYTNEFAKNIDLCYKRNLDLSLLIEIIKILVTEGVLPAKYKPHTLKGYKIKKGEIIMECHIKPDWLLIWIQNNSKFTLLLSNSGSHSDLF
jgi:mRNA interferase YafQ